jgi:hypothetical protein
VVDSESGSFGSSERERHIWKLLFSGRESIINLKEYMEKSRVNGGWVWRVKIYKVE